MNRPNYRARGFTLLEVLIALAIVALSVGALMGTVTSSSSNTNYLREKTLAEWVALNRVTEVRISRDMPSEGRRKGSSTMGGMRWEWEEEVTELPVEGMFRVDVRAHSTGEAVDDSKPVDKPSQQVLTPSTTSGGEMKDVAWMSQATGVVGSSRSGLQTPIGAPFSGDVSTTSGNPPGGPGDNPAPPRTGAPAS